MVASSPVRHEPPVGMQGNPVEVQSYQTPWKALSEFAMQGDMDQGHAPFQQLVSHALAQQQQQDTPMSINSSMGGHGHHANGEGTAYMLNDGLFSVRGNAISPHRLSHGHTNSIGSFSGNSSWGSDDMGSKVPGVQNQNFKPDGSSIYDFDDEYRNDFVSEEEDDGVVYHEIM